MEAAGAPVTIRRFQPADTAQVLELFSSGIRDSQRFLTSGAFNHSGRPGRLLQAACAAVPAAAVAALWKQAVHLRAVGLLASAVLVPSCTWLYMKYVIEEYISGSLADDLVDIEGAYCAPGSAFWVAEQHGKVVGCVGLQRQTGSTAELRRMSVRRELRGQGVGSILAQELIQHAKSQGLKEIFLVTPATHRAAITLYQKHGWAVTSTWREGLMTYAKLVLQLI